MRLVLKSAVLVVVMALCAFQARAQQQVAQDATQALQSLDPATAAALQTALANGDALAVQLVVASVAGDAAANTAVATIVLAAAQSIKAADPGGAGVLAAIAFSSGGLQGTAAATAANIVNVSGSVIATTVITLSQNGAPPPVVASVLVGVTTNPVLIAQNGANVVSSNEQSGSIQ